MHLGMQHRFEEKVILLEKYLQQKDAGSPTFKI
jgi:hypothetical protein